LLLTVGPELAVRVPVLGRPATWRKIDLLATGHRYDCCYPAGIGTCGQATFVLAFQNPSPRRHSRNTGVAQQAQFPPLQAGRQVQNNAQGSLVYVNHPHLNLACHVERLALPGTRGKKVASDRSDRTHGGLTSPSAAHERRSSTGHNRRRACCTTSATIVLKHESPSVAALARAHSRVPKREEAAQRQPRGYRLSPHATTRRASLPSHTRLGVCRP
jgi:hypothetical protein